MVMVSRGGNSEVTRHLELNLGLPGKEVPPPVTSKDAHYQRSGIGVKSELKSRRCDRGCRLHEQCLQVTVPNVHPRNIFKKITLFIEIWLQTISVTIEGYVLM